MKKFTIFTLILTIVVIVVASEIVVNEYLPSLGKNDTTSLEFTLPDGLDLSKSMTTNVIGDELTNRLGADSEENVIDYSDEFSDGSIPIASVIAGATETIDTVGSTDINGSPEAGSNGSTESGLNDFEDENFAPQTETVYLRDEQIKSAGFVSGYIEKELFDDHLFKTIYVGDLYDTEIEKDVVRTKDSLLLKVYIFKIGIDSDVDEVYQLLKLRAKESLETEINENNEFGINSFYMNDSNRSGTAFVVVRIGSIIYAFSYPKEYHPQVKNLIQLLEWEFK